MKNTKRTTHKKQHKYQHGYRINENRAIFFFLREEKVGKVGRKLFWIAFVPSGFSTAMRREHVNVI